MQRRGITFVLALFYLLQATWLLHAGADLFFPRLREAVSSGESCCVNRCGCPEEAQARKACCCGPTAAAPAPAKGPASSIEEARCRGAEEAMAQALTQPTVCGFAAHEPCIGQLDRVEPPCVVPGRVISSIPPEKVPIA